MNIVEDLFRERGDWMRLTSLDHIKQIKQQYLDLRSAGVCRKEATTKVIRDFRPQDPQQKVTFWIGLADAQYLRKELTLSVSLQALLALHRLKRYDITVTPGDIERRRKHYSQAPMPERKLGRPPKKN